MTVFSMIASNWRYINFIPYSSILHAYSSFMQQTVYYWKSFETINISYFIVFSIVGYILYRYKNGGRMIPGSEGVKFFPAYRNE